jgi:predicted glycosyltransferase involved in capsule biosynthesis
MTNPFLFTFIIGYRHSIDRLHTLRRTLDWINGFSGGDIIVVEQDTHSKISHLNLRCRHILIKSNLPYNRSWGFNVALKQAKSDIIIFGDSDMIIQPNDFINGINSLKDYEMVSPNNILIDLTKEESNLQLEDFFKINRPGRGETDNQKINISSGISMYRKESIVKIGGWNEDFWSWGGEDDFQTIKVKHFLSWAELKSKCYHLYHERVSPDMKYYQKSLQILQRANTMTKDDLQKSISKQINKIGMKNKCDTFTR